MSAPLSSSRTRNGVTIPTIWLAAALSLLVHVAVLWKLPTVKLPAEDPSAQAPLIVELARPPRPPRPPAARPPTREIVPPRAPARTERARPPPQPPVVARNEPAPRAPPRPPPPAKAPGIAVPPPPAAPGATDLASYVEARRRSRGDTAPAAPAAPAPSPATPERAETAAERANRIAAANLGLDRKPAFGPDRRKSGGVFEVTRLGYDYGEFLFYGWNKEIRRDTMQHIEVRKGDASDIRVAMVRKMISIIRQHEQEDFVWESQRLNRNVTLSARARDNSGLEEFMMREFFGDPRRPPPGG
jgi:hypothetical protein